MSPRTRMVLLFLLVAMFWPIALACFALTMVHSPEGFVEAFLFLLVIGIGSFFTVIATYASLELLTAIRKWLDE